MKYQMMICCDCGKSVERFSGNQKRCEACKKAHAKSYIKAYCSTPRMMAWRNAWMKAYRNTAKRKAFEKAYAQTPKRKACNKARKQTPEYKAYSKASSQSIKATKNIFNLIALNTALQERSVA